MEEETLITKQEEYPEIEGCILFNTGRVRIWFPVTNPEDPEGEDIVKRWDLRLPRFREYRRFREGVAAMQTQMETEDEQQQVVVEWTVDVIKTLDTKKRPLPEDPEDWPIWLRLGFLQGALINHWTSVPLVLGVRGQTPQTTPGSQLKVV